MTTVVIATPNGDVRLERADQKEALLAAWTLLEYEFKSIQLTCWTDEEKGAVKDDAWLQFSKFCNGARDQVQFGEITIWME